MIEVVDGLDLSGVPVPFLEVCPIALNGAYYADSPGLSLPRVRPHRRRIDTNEPTPTRFPRYRHHHPTI